MKAVTVTSDETGKEINRVETTYANVSAAKSDAITRLNADESAVKCIVHEDKRPEPAEGETGVPNRHDPAWFTPRVIFQRHIETGEPELIGESWP